MRLTNKNGFYEFLMSPVQGFTTFAIQ